MRMMKYWAVALMMLAVGCGDERGGDGGKEAEKSDLTIMFDVNLSGLSDDCIYPGIFNYFEEVLDIKSDGNEPVSTDFFVDGPKILNELRENTIANHPESTAAVDYISVDFWVYGKATDDFELILYERRKDKVVEIDKALLVAEEIGKQVGPRVSFSKLNPKSKGAYEIETTAGNEIELYAGLSITGKYVKSTCLQPAD